MMEDIENLIILCVGQPMKEISSKFIFTEQYQKVCDCKTYLKSLETTKHRIFLIISDYTCVDVSPLLEHPLIIAFYLFKTKLTVRHGKNHGSFNDNESLFEKIYADIGLYYRNFSAPWNVFDSSTTQTSLNNLSVDNVAFVWNQVLLDILCKMPNSDDEQAKEEWLAECILAYSRDKSDSEKKRIEKFAREYCPDDATKWYSDTGFVYRLLNQALRTKNIVNIYKCRFMLRQLYQQLEKLPQDTKNELQGMTVHRGQQITEEDLKKLIRSKGQLISMNAFLSTSIDNEVASKYLPDDITSSDGKHWIKFTITIDPEATLSHNLAYIGMKDLTTKPDEMEVLFAPGAVFRIETVSVRKENHHIWEMKLCLASNDQCLEINKYIEQIHNKYTQNSEPLLKLASILAEMGQTDTALIFYRVLIQQLNSDGKKSKEDVICVFCDMGSLYFDVGQYRDAIRFYKKASDIMCGTSPLYVKNFVEVLSHLGSAYTEIGDCAQAKLFFLCALHYSKCFLDGCWDTHAHLYNNMGRLEQIRKNSDLSLQYYEKSLNILENHLPNEYKYLGEVQNNIANIHQEKKRYDLAIQQYKKIIKLHKKILPSENILSVKVYSNMALCYRNQQNFNDARKCIEKSINLANEQTTLNYDVIATCYHVYADYYSARQEYIKAKEEIKLCLEHAQLAGLSDDHPSMILYKEQFEDIERNIKNAQK